MVHLNIKKLLLSINRQRNPLVDALGYVKYVYLDYEYRTDIKFVCSLTTFALCQKHELCQILNHNPEYRVLSSLNYDVHICPNCSRFDMCSRIKLCDGCTLMSNTIKKLCFQPNCPIGLKKLRDD